jgi:hypothetical protein
MNYIQKHMASAAWLVTFLLLASGCSNPPPGEEALLQALDETVDALEARDLDAVMERVDGDFRLSRSEGELGYQATRTLLMHSLRRYQKIAITLTNVQVEIDPVKLDEADVRFNALLTAGRGWLPDDGNLYRVTSRWVYDGKWRVQALESKRALE